MDIGSFFIFDLPLTQEKSDESFDAAACCDTLSVCL